MADEEKQYRPLPGRICPVPYDEDCPVKWFLGGIFVLMLAPYVLVAILGLIWLFIDYVLVPCGYAAAWVFAWLAARGLEFLP